MTSIDSQAGTPASHEGFTSLGVLGARNQLLAAVLVFASINGLAPRAIESVTLKNWGYGILNTFDVSVFVWGAWAAACYLILREDNPDRIRPLDVAVAGVMLALAAMPVPQLSWLCLCVLSVYVFFTSRKGSPQQRSAIIFFAICVPMLWGPLFLSVAAAPLLTIDAFLVSTVMGTQRNGNLVMFLDGVHSMQIWALCSSFHSISQAALAWVALSQALGRPLALRDVAWCGLGMALAAAVNLARLSLMAVSPQYFTAIHSQTGADIVNGLTVILIVSICMYGQRRELFARA